jgi:hypothetical protein
MSFDPKKINFGGIGVMVLVHREKFEIEYDFCQSLPRRSRLIPR